MKSAPILILSNDSTEALHLTQTLIETLDQREVGTAKARLSDLREQVRVTRFELAILDLEGVTMDAVAELVHHLKLEGLSFLICPPSSKGGDPRHPFFTKMMGILSASCLGLVPRQADAFQLMLAVESGLQRSQQLAHLHGMAHGLESTLLSLPHPVMTTDIEGNLTQLNGLAEKTMGWSRSEALHRNCAEILSLSDPGNGARLTCPVTFTLRNRRSCVSGNALLRTRSHQQLLVEYHCAPIRDDTGHMFGCVLVLRPAGVVGQSSGLPVVNENPAELWSGGKGRLELASTELDTFSYTVAHDLRAPLRAIHGFSSLLRQSPTLALDPESREFLEAIASNAARMDRMIDEYLRLARVEATGNSREPLNINALVQEVWSELGQSRHEPMPELQLAQLPPMLGEKELIRQMWFNLVSNAIKFSSKKKSPRIEIGSEFREGRLCYWIRDNGVGFTSSQADRLFLPFRRLHDAKEFPGEGVGLSLVHRIVRKHGGTIQAEGIEGQGALFRILLPCSVSSDCEGIENVTCAMNRKADSPQDLGETPGSLSLPV